jgi:dethiobiotin synthetase
VTAIFVTGSGTDVGKTFVTAGLVRHWRGAGRAVAAIKPVASGFDPGRPETSDPAVLLGALGRSCEAAEIARVSPWRFAAPLSPDMAAAREGRGIDFAALVEFCRKAERQDGLEPGGVLLIEGVGGIMVPLDRSHTVLDWMSALRHPVLLVAGSYVGTISHTLTALQVLVRRNLDVAAVVVSESEGSAAPLGDTVATIARFADSIDVVALPRGGDAAAGFAKIAALL